MCLRTTIAADVARTTCLTWSLSTTPPSSARWRRNGNSWLWNAVSAASDNALSAEIIDQRNAIRDGGALGVWDVERRLTALDDEGVAAEIVNVGHHLSITPFFTMLSRPHPSELRSAGARAHHRWFAAKMAPGKGRIFGVADPGGCEDMEAAVREVHWCADHGFVAMGCPHATEDKTRPLS